MTKALNALQFLQSIDATEMDEQTAVLVLGQDGTVREVVEVTDHSGSYGRPCLGIVVGQQVDDDHDSGVGNRDHVVLAQLVEYLGQRIRNLRDKNPRCEIALTIEYNSRTDVIGWSASHMEHQTPSE